MPPPGLQIWPRRLVTWPWSLTYRTKNGCFVLFSHGSRVPICSKIGYLFTKHRVHKTGKRRTDERPGSKHSVDTRNYVQPRTRFGERASSYAGPAVWNSLPDELRRTQTINSFKRKLKTYFFTSAFSWFYFSFLNMYFEICTALMFLFLYCKFFMMMTMMMIMIMPPQV